MTVSSARFSGKAASPDGLRETARPSAEAGGQAPIPRLDGTGDDGVQSHAVHPGIPDMQFCLTSPHLKGEQQ